MSDERARRQEVADTARALAERRLTPGRSGNVSARHGSGLLITPSGLPYESLAAHQIVWMSLEGSHAEGELVPSSEWRLHAAIYRARPDAEAIVHAHPRYCVALAAARREIPAFHYMVAVAGGNNIRCAAYATFGSEQLALNAVAALRERRACLLANHGAITLAGSLGAALDLMGEVETLAAQYCAALSVGGVVLLPDFEMERVLERFKGYGQTEIRSGSR